MASSRMWLTPYNYVQNNPIMNTDPTGALDNGGGGGVPPGVQAVGKNIEQGVKNLVNGVSNFFSNLFSSGSSEPTTTKVDVTNNVEQSETKQEVKKGNNSSSENTTDIQEKRINSKGIPKDSGFNLVVEEVLDSEGGWKNEPSKDKGDPTNRGISWPTWKANAKKVLGIEPTVENLKNITAENAKQIYFEVYWDKPGFESIKNEKLAAIIFDWSVNSGEAIKEIQKLLNSKFDANIGADGSLGPKTIAAINDVENVKGLYNKIIETRVSYYEKGAEKGWFDKSYLKGLKNRANKWKGKI